MALLQERFCRLRSLSLTMVVCTGSLSLKRAMLRAVGFGDGDFDKPIVGIANKMCGASGWASLYYDMQTKGLTPACLLLLLLALQPVLHL